MIRTQFGTVVQPGDFAAVRVDGAVGRLIRVGQFLNGSGFRNYEHAIFYAGDDEKLGQDLILEAEPGGARLVPFHYSPGDVLWSSDAPPLALNATQRQLAMVIARHYKGVPYSALDYFALAAHRLHIRTPMLKYIIGSTHQMICSQLADQCRLEMGSHLFSDSRWPGFVTPADLADLILSCITNS